MMATLKPVLKHDEIVNGMMEIEIVNLDDIYDDDLQFECILSHQFEQKKDSPYYPNNEWISNSFGIESIDEFRKFSVKVPLFLLSYSIKYKLEIKTFKLNNIDNNNKYELFKTFTSNNYFANIPSILIDDPHKIGDYIQYKIDNDAPMRYGTILQLNKNNMIKIKTDQAEKDEILTIHASKVYRVPTSRQFLIDITNRTPAQIDLILKTNDEQKIDFFMELAHYLWLLYQDGIDGNYENQEIFNNDCVYLSGLIATNIYQFLFVDDYNYRIHCMLDGGHLYFGNAWKDYIATHFGYDLGADTYTIKDLNDELNGKAPGYSCDICRGEISWYDNIFSCKKDRFQVFCVSCIHSIFIQYNEMKPFLSKLLIDILNNNCIEEIVTFCVGKVSKFEIKMDCHEMEEDINNDTDSICYDIDDSKTVGCKRKLTVRNVNASRKRRKLQ